MKKQTLYMETTGIDAQRTAGEVISELVSAGANQIATTYDQGRVIGLRWVMKVNGIDQLFEMQPASSPYSRC